MKTGFFSIATICLLQLAASQPYRHQHHQHRRRDVIVVTNIEYATVHAADVVVYVDNHGKPVTTKTIFHNQATPTDASSTPSLVEIKETTSTPFQASKLQSSKSQTPKSQTPKPELPKSELPKPEPTKHQFPKPQAPKAEPPKPEHPKSEPSKPEPPKPELPNPGPDNKPLKPDGPIPSQVSSGPGFSSGISYSPYNADNSCKSSEQVQSDFQMINGYSIIRLYGTDCDQVANVISATKGKGISLFLGIFDINNVAKESKDIISAVNGNWDIINSVSVGNELVNNGGASVGQVTAAIGQARDALKAAGYSGPIVTVDTMVAMKAHPELCHASDFCAINCHAFFDGNVLPDGAGDFVQLWAKQVSEAAGGKTVVITETGWPTQGDHNNKAIPSKENQAAAIASIQNALGQNVIIFNAFNDLWKQDSGTTFGAERYWGVHGNAPSHSGG